MRYAHNSVIRLRNHRLICILAIFFLASCGLMADSKSHTSAAQDPQKESYHAQPYQGRLEPDDGQWVRPAKDYASLRYSSLNQVNTGNVKNLQLAFTFSTG